MVMGSALSRFQRVALSTNSSVEDRLLHEEKLKKKGASSDDAEIAIIVIAEKNEATGNAIVPPTPLNFNALPYSHYTGEQASATSRITKLAVSLPGYYSNLPMAVISVFKYVLVSYVTAML